MREARLIVLNGFAGSGKSTIGRRYIKENPLALLVEGDELIVNVGQWLENEPKARDLVLELTKSLASTHLSKGYDVVIPYLVTKASHIDVFREIAANHNADFFNFLLFNEKDTAIERLLERGTWGEAGLDPLSDKDMPEIINLYDQMEVQLEAQKDAIKIAQKNRSIDDTYAAILEHINNQSRT